MRSGCRDFRTGDTITLQTFFDDSVDIHHIFPEDWCIKAGVEPATYNSIINKTAISARTNRSIGGRAPTVYLAKIEEETKQTRTELASVLATHGIEPALLYRDEFQGFFARRGRHLVAMIEAAMGKPVAQEGADFLGVPSMDEYEEEGPEWSDDGPA